MRRLAAAALLAVSAVAIAQDGAPPDPQAPAPEPQAARAPEAAEKRSRRERLAALAGPKAAVLVLAADNSPGFTGSTQNRDYTYLSPFDARGAAVFVALTTGAAGTVPSLTDRLYLRARDPRMERWTGPVAGPGAETRDAGAFGDCLAVDRLAADLADAMRDRSVLWLSGGGPADGSRLAAPLVAALRTKLPNVWVRLAEAAGGTTEDFAESVRRALPEKLPREKTAQDVLASLPVLDVKPAERLIAELREVKSPAEIARIRAATDATVAGMFDAIRAAEPGMFEMAVAGCVEFRCRLGGCARQAYPSIVGSGPNSCILHYGENTRRMADGDLVVMDIGGEYEGYATDVTRTFPANGKFTEEQARVYDAVLAAQEAGIAAVKPGVTLKDVHAAASAVLKEKGLIQFFPHGTSHSVGLDVHDPFRADVPMRAGFVLTVEPGVYIAATGLGVRIEDTVLVTETGCEVLSRALPKTRAEIEKLMSEPAPYPPR